MSLHFIVQVIELQSCVMASVKRFHSFAATDGQSQREYSQPQHHERHHPTLHCPPSRRSHFSPTLILETVVRLDSAFGYDEQTCCWTCPCGGGLGCGCSRKRSSCSSGSRRSIGGSGGGGRSGSSCSSGCSRGGS